MSSEPAIRKITLISIENQENKTTVRVPANKDLTPNSRGLRTLEAALGPGAAAAQLFDSPGGKTLVSAVELGSPGALDTFSKDPETGVPQVRLQLSSPSSSR